LAPGNKDALMALAVFYRATSQNDRAEAMLSEALALDPSDRAVYVQLVALYMTTGRFDQAASVLREAQDLDPGDPEPSLLLSMLYRSEGRAAEADRILLDLRETFPSDTGVAASLAQALMLEDPERSRAEIDRILQIDPEGTAGHILLGTWLFTEGRYEEAEASLSRDRVVEGSSPVASFLLGRIAEIRGDPDRARIEFRNSVNLNPAYLPARLALAELLIRQGGRLEEARVEVSGVLALDPRSVPGRLARGALDTAGGRYEEAEAAFAELRREEPDNARVHLRTGLNHEASGSAARAEDSLRRALGLDPGSEEILAHLARFYASRGRVDDAIRAITDAARHLERPSVHHHLMGLAYLQGGRLNEAEAAFRTAVELEPGRADSRGFLARLCLEAGRPGEALEHTDALLRLRPLDPGAHTTRALILETQGDVAAAKASYTRALEIDPDSFPAANNLAYILGEEGLLGEALGWAQNARRAEPANPNVADTLGWIQHRLGNQVLARQQLEFAVSVEPENPAFLYHLAMVYREAGQPAEAADALGRALDSGRDFADRELAEAALSEIGESR
jgi:tetratricopeptide (TPR) repeat protein